MKILIAEDDSIIRGALDYTLKKDNHEITVCKDGSDAIDKIKIDTPDVVITDIMMPFVTGLELIQWIKENYGDSIKIMVLTSIGDEDVVIEAFSLGVDDFLTKPFNAEELSIRVKRFLL
ncbi:transcriptional regulator [Wenyingzhuangia fucanilytica]|uniref:Transcriptional regulator n=1 Tax=Wenyingzhuangia fucanilytica TaxID=1790137 RepID=A0A1B1Y765_9FLAO|nr:response regulator transcription factor [Wenyingzhuangia fucanilytica]ANW96606.1 transcriptional regulator [Wenyingzhuangia fucanilytica]